MLVLALDTCFNRCAACLHDSATGDVVAEEAQMMERGHAEALAPLVQRVIKNHQVDRIAVTTGPGTFTGLRVGLSFARALGLAKNIPVIGLDSLHAIALSDPTNLVAHQAGKSGFAYVLRPGHDIALVKQDELAEPPANELPDLQILARWAAAQPAPSHMPNPVYLRETDAKPQVTPSTVRTAGADDLPQLAALHAACFAHGWTVADLQSMHSIAGTQALIAENGNIAGMVILRAIAGEAEILTICVAPALRHKGIATKLMQAASALPLEKIFLEVAHTNEAARALYKAQGFTETGLRRGYYSDGADAVTMTKVLK